MFLYKILFICLEHNCANWRKRKLQERIFASVQKVDFITRDSCSGRYCWEREL